MLRNEDGEGPITIFGPTCDGEDIVASECKLPELGVDDLIVFYDMGAYTTFPASNFNGSNGFNRFATSTYHAYIAPK